MSGICALCPNWGSIETSGCGNCVLWNKITTWITECDKEEEE